MMNDEELIYQIYNTLYEPDSWKETLANIAKALDSTHIFLLARDHATSQPFAFIESGFDGSYFQQYQEYFYQHDVWTQSLVGHSENQFHASHQVCDDRLFLKSEIYNDFAIPANIRHSIGCLITNPNQEMVAEVALMRGREQAYYDEQTQQRASRLVRHFQQSLNIAYRLRSSNLGIHTFQQFLDSQAEALIICNQQGLLLQYNTAADFTLRAGNLLKIASSKAIVFTDTNAQKKFESGLSQMSVTNTDCSFIVTSVLGVVKVKLQPWIHSQIHPLGLVRSSAVMVTIQPLRCSVYLEQSNLMQHYGLTKSEAEILHTLCSGASLQEISAMRNTSIHTVRQQVKICLQKTGARSQSELVSRVLMQHLD